MTTKGAGTYAGPDEFAHVYLFVPTWAEAEAEAHAANRRMETRNGKFVAGTFSVQHMPGRVPAVVGTLSGA
jgi:hypothetical protein